MFLRNRTGPAGATRGAIRLPDYIEPKTGNAIARSAEYTFSYRNSYVTADAKGEVIHLDSVVLQVEGGGSIQSNLDMRPGQLLVIGKTNYGSSSALVTILTAKILD
jgi:hypothetical protein